MNIAADQVPTEADDDPGVLHVRASHVIVRQVDRCAEQALQAFGADARIELVEALGFVFAHALAMVNVADHQHRTAALAVRNAFARDPLRWRRVPFCDPEHDLADALCGILFDFQLSH